jgi:hypothetical protein
MNAPVADMSLVLRSRTLILLDAMACSFTGSLAENLFDRRCSFIDNSFLVGIYDKSLINDEYLQLLCVNIVQILTILIIGYVVLPANQILVN